MFDTSMFEKYSEQARRTLVFARYEASKLGTGIVESEHVLLGVLREEEESFGQLVTRLGLNPEGIRRAVEGSRLSRIGQISAMVELPLSADCEEILDLAVEEAQLLGDVALRSEHLLLGILRRTGCGAARLLARHGVELEPARREVRALRRAERPQWLSDSLPLLSEFGRDLTAAAAVDGFDPLIGRDQEVERLFQILARRHKNNPLLIGEPGVGKTAIVEGVAERLANGRAPRRFRGKRLFSLDLSLIVAGTKFRGQFEERLKGILEELAAHREILVFIDEVHGLVGAGSAEGSLDAANILKPAISRGELAVIGATTPREYRRYIEKDRSLLRRFQPVLVEPPSPEKSCEILAGLRPRYEAFHGVRYHEEALRAAVQLSNRYVGDRFLPDKAIDVLDEAGALVSLATANVSGPEEPEVGRADIEAVISAATGIPVQRLQSAEAERLLAMEEILGRRVIGQERALSAISRALRRAKLRVGSPRRPIGSFLFLGPSGVGKTEVARQLSEFLFDSQRALVRFDMSEFMELHAVAKLTGSPPGYVGYEEGGQLTERIRRQPYSLILFDEIEKAHPDVTNLLLQVLEDGVLTDSFGNHVDFRNTLILMTSNVGSQFLIQRSRVGFRKNEPGALRGPEEAEVLAELKRGFRPEFLNRLDEVIVFNPLGKPELRSIVDLQIEELNADLADSGVRLEVTPAAREWLLEAADLDPATGARPLRRTVERHLRDAVSTLLARHHGEALATLQVDVVGGELQLEIASSSIH